MRARRFAGGYLPLGFLRPGGQSGGTARRPGNAMKCWRRSGRGGNGVVLERLWDPFLSTVRSPIQGLGPAAATSGVRRKRSCARAKAAGPPVTRPHRHHPMAVDEAKNGDALPGVMQYVAGALSFAGGGSGTREGPLEARGEALASAWPRPRPGMGGGRTPGDHSTRTVKAGQTTCSKEGRAGG